MTNQIVPDKIKLTSVKVVNGSIDCAQELALKNPHIAHLTTNFEADFGVNSENKSVSYFLKIKLQAFDTEMNQMKIKAEYSLSFVFIVENLSDYIVEKTASGIVVELMLASTLMGIAYSTARGIILSRTEGTILGGVILPVLDPRNLIAHKAQKNE